MRITLGNIDGKALALNASEACVYAAIEKCSKGENAKGWYGTMEALAGVLPCRIYRTTVSRAIAKLLTLGLIKEEGERLYANVQIAQNDVQNAHENVQNAHENVQNAHENVQIALPPNNPPINNKKMNEEIKEQPRADMRTRDVAKQQSSENLMRSFIIFKNYWIKKSGVPQEFEKRAMAIWTEWRMMSEAKRDAVEREISLAFISKTQPEHWKDNPLFFLRDFPEPEPKDYNGARLLPNEPLVIAKYNDRAGLYTRREAELFGMNILRPFVP